MHGAVAGEFANRAAGKAQRVDDKTVGCDRNLGAVDIDMCGVSEWPRSGAEKQRSEQAFDEFPAGLASGTMRHLNLWVTEADVRGFGKHSERSGRYLEPQAIELRATIAALRCS